VESGNASILCADGSKIQLTVSYKARAFRLERASKSASRSEVVGRNNADGFSHSGATCFLIPLSSLNFERLQGYPNRYSARVTIKYRIEMEIDWENQEKTVGLVGIVELSGHYGGR